MEIGWVVVDIGCIECGEQTKVMGVYRSLEQAQTAHEVGDYFTQGQRAVEIHEAPVFLESRTEDIPTA